MRIKVNENDREVPNNIKLLELFESLNIDQQKGMAVAVNNEITSRSEWRDRQLMENDRILVIKATNGG